jgi:predicted TIM-barrel fold metal-dependent hydrolase
MDKIQMIVNYNFFQIFLKGELLRFVKYEMIHLTVTWNEVQWAFISWFNEIHSEGQTIVALKYTKQKKYEYVENYYDRFLQFCVVIPQRPHDNYLREVFK